MRLYLERIRFHLSYRLNLNLLYFGLKDNVQRILDTRHLALRTLHYSTSPSNLASICEYWANHLYYTIAKDFVAHRYCYFDWRLTR